MKIKAVRGTRDILPDEIPAWQLLEQAAQRLLSRYGYREIQETRRKCALIAYERLQQSKGSTGR